MMACIKKLKSKAGESLVESLCAILIFTMASIVLFSMVSAAADINNTAKEQDKINQDHLVAVEKGEDATRNGSAKITFTLQNGSNSREIASVDVDIYGGQGGSLYTYFVKPAEQGG